MATSIAPASAPYTTRAAVSATALRARAGRASTAQSPKDDQVVTRALPKRTSRRGMPTIAAKAPPEAPSRARPSTPLASRKSAWTAGMRANQFETRTPWMKKTTATETRADFSRCVSFLARDRAVGGGGHEPRVLGQSTRAVARPGGLDRPAPPLDLGRGELDVETPLLHVDVHDVAVSQDRDGPSVRGLRRDVADHEAVRRPREAPVRHEGHGIAQPRALQRARHVQHLAHAGSALRPFPADHDDVARLHLPLLHGREGVLLAIEDERGPPVRRLRLARHLGHAAFRGQVAAQDGDASVSFQGLGQGANDLLAGRFRGPARLLADRPARDRELLLVQ